VNPKLQVVFQRRSIRRYKNANISPVILQDLLKAAMAAPSACAKDPWHFIVIHDKATLGRMADGMPNGQMLREAAAAIMVCGDPGRVHDGQLSYLLQDCSAAIENILIAATALDLGACWLGSHPREDRLSHLRAVLGIPDSIIPVSVVALGWPAEDKVARTRYDATRIHLETWAGHYQEPAPH
jgi:nitroreductase